MPTDIDAEAALRRIHALDPAAVVERIFTLYGGKDKFFEETKRRFEEFNKIWYRESGGIGAVLHAHLVVEHYLTLHLQRFYPDLPDLAPLRLTFGTKLGLISDRDRTARHLKPGLLQLNSARNKLAHRMHLDIEPADISEISKVEMYTAMYRASGKPPITEPLEILLDFALFAAGWLNNDHGPQKDLWSEALGLSDAESDVT